MGKTKRRYPTMPRRRRSGNPFGSNPMPRMMRDVNNTTLGMMGIGTVAIMGTGVLGALKK